MAILDAVAPAPRTMGAGKSDAEAAVVYTEAERKLLDRIGQQIEGARTLTEIMEAQSALRTWANQHPADRGRLSAVFEQLAMQEESAREALAEAEAMGLTPEEFGQREQLFALRRQVCAEDAPATFAAALSAAREALERWQASHPDDPQLLYLCEQLSMEEHMAKDLHRHGVWL